LKDNFNKKDERKQTVRNALSSPPQSWTWYQGSKSPVPVMLSTPCAAVRTAAWLSATCTPSIT
ncbi:hypothetical protein, partial [Serratia ureilytica]|uniref:hypothetical protein n=1 Tax=Serratia ureilytica TaxID=300181 RepID=UPI003FA72824